eukprot:scaffold5138_cov74-Skeletonema_menzelii.AAC.2
MRSNQHIRHSIMPDPSDPSGQAIEGKCNSESEIPFETADPVAVPPVPVLAPPESATSSSTEPQGFNKGKNPPKPPVTHPHGNSSLSVYTKRKVSSAPG